MNDDLQNLITLQRLDSVIDSLQLQEDEIKSSLESEKSAVVECEQRVEAAKASSQECTVLTRSLETDVQELDDKMEKYRGQLNDVKSNREYAALQIEISNLQDKKDRLEEQIIKEMEKCEVAKQEVQTVEDALGTERQILQVKQAEQQQKIDVLRGEKRNEEGVRENAASKLRKILSDKYDNIRTVRGGLAIVEIKGGSCQGCFINLPPQLVIEVRKGVEILDCYSCGRILYINE